MTLYRNMETEENREFWAEMEAMAKAVDAWPDWKKVMLCRAREAEMFFDESAQGQREVKE